jgi:hypothetical protein
MYINTSFDANPVKSELLKGGASWIDGQGWFAKVDVSYPLGQLEFADFGVRAHLQHQLDILIWHQCPNTAIRRVLLVCSLYLFFNFHKMSSFCPYCLFPAFKGDVLKLHSKNLRELCLIIPNSWSLSSCIELNSLIFSLYQRMSWSSSKQTARFKRFELQLRDNLHGVKVQRENFKRAQ